MSQGQNSGENRFLTSRIFRDSHWGPLSLFPVRFWLVSPPSFSLFFDAFSSSTIRILCPNRLWQNISFLIKTCTWVRLSPVQTQSEKRLRVRREVQAVIFGEVNSGKHVLILKKKDFSAKHYRWRLLKGGVNEGETEIEALQREIFEEAGLKNLKVLDRINSYQFVFKNVRHVVSSYLVKADYKEPIRLQKSEVDDYIWTSKEKALRMLHWDNEKDALKQLK